MGEGEKSYIDAKTPNAVLIVEGRPYPCPTISEAVAAWRRLQESEKKRRAIIKIEGRTYSASDIDQMHFGPEP